MGSAGRGTPAPGSDLRRSEVTKNLRGGVRGHPLNKQEPRRGWEKKARKWATDLNRRCSEKTLGEGPRQRWGRWKSHARDRMGIITARARSGHPESPPEDGLGREASTRELAEAATSSPSSGWFLANLASGGAAGAASLCAVYLLDLPKPDKVLMLGKGPEAQEFKGEVTVLGKEQSQRDALVPTKDATLQRRALLWPEPLTWSLRHGEGLITQTKETHFSPPFRCSGIFSRPLATECRVPRRDGSGKGLGLLCEGRPREGVGAFPHGAFSRGLQGTGCFSVGVIRQN